MKKSPPEPRGGHAREKGFPGGEDQPMNYLVPCDATLDIAGPFTTSKVRLPADDDQSTATTPELGIFEDDPVLNRGGRPGELENDYLTGKVW